MGSAHKIISACLRVFEFGCCVIILGILGRFFYVLNRINGPSDSRLIYAITIAAISTALAIILLPPLTYSFHFFAIDFALFICWIVCFALLEDLTGANTCSSGWLNSYWNVYWTSNTGNTTIVTRHGCSRWRVVLAFSFIVAFAWLLSGFLSVYACVEYHDLGARIARIVRRITWWKKPKQADLEKSTAYSGEQQLLPKVGPPAQTVPRTQT